MSAKKEEQKVDYNVDDIVDEFEMDSLEAVAVPVDNTVEEEKPKTRRTAKKVVAEENEDNLINCLRNARIIVRHVPKQTNMVSNPKHILYGKMAENAVRSFVVPRLASSGAFVNVLTNDEKDYLEHIMGLEPNALSVHKRKDNFWDDGNEVGVSSVRLTKQDNYLNLSDPEDYIKYKILLANKDYIAPNLDALVVNPKATYQFVIVEEGAVEKRDKDKLSIKMQCYKEFAKISDDKDILRVLVETLDGRPTSQDVKLEFLQTKADNLISANSELFYKLVTDKTLGAKVIIHKAIEAGLIYKKGTYHYLTEDNSPLCEKGLDPTIDMAAKYLLLPKNQHIKFTLEAKIK